MKRLLCLLFALLLCTGCAGAEQAFSLLGEPLTGNLFFSGDESQMTYSLPQLSASDDVSATINRFYAERELQLEVLWQTDEWQDPSGDLSYAMTYGDKRYVSFAFTLLRSAGNGEIATLWADTFAMDGLYAGEKLCLSQLLGLEEEISDAEGPSLASQLAYRLVWQIASQESLNPDGDYLDGLTERQVQNAFDPEQDFYLDEDGNVVFFIQSGEIAGEIAGILEYPFSVAEMLSAVE